MRKAKVKVKELTDQEKDEIEAFALELFKSKRLSDRRFTLWQRILRGETIQQILDSKTMTGKRATLYAELQRAKTIIQCAWMETHEGTIRLGITADTGHEPQWKSDKTLQQRCPDSESNWPLEQLEKFGKRGKHW